MLWLCAVFLISVFFLRSYSNVHGGSVSRDLFNEGRCVCVSERELVFVVAEGPRWVRPVVCGFVHGQCQMRCHLISPDVDFVQQLWAWLNVQVISRGFVQQNTSGTMQLGHHHKRAQFTWICFNRELLSSCPLLDCFKFGVVLLAALQVALLTCSTAVQTQLSLHEVNRTQHPTHEFIWHMRSLVNSNDFILFLFFRYIW